MMMKTLRIQPVKTLLTALFIVVGIVTIANYQKLEVVSLDGVLGLLQNAEYATILLNLMSLLGLAIMAFVWIRPTFAIFSYFHFLFTAKNGRTSYNRLAYCIHFWR
ncbi:hypothetical protein [Metasolibacillus sp.]|uniref:hypothetical protein n=1 Tax=Metasolibacillus sp. TaxID=2703680 RepID=UPI0025DD1A28|nr:hypothetical protein [Metasolibacillus sp.]MCT6925373.1 hypothetical protein [Metasolibacillus sp.]MCT6941599.1 hypothetical protein [Metasolibacillus sp.]